MSTQEDIEPSATTATTGRFAAGEDPAKREQILDGAWIVFRKLGFDAASMNDITREAGVSKGTIYVYFANKEDLFAALIDRHRTRFAEAMRDVLAGEQEVEEGLKKFGFTFSRQMTCSEVIPAMRSVIGVIDRMPGLAKRFFASSPVNIKSVLQDFIEHHVKLGNLQVDDIELSARQYIELSSGPFFKLRLFGEINGDVPQQELDRVVNSAVRVFMAAYGTKNG